MALDLERIARQKRLCALLAQLAGELAGLQGAVQISQFTLPLGLTRRLDEAAEYLHLLGLLPDAKRLEELGSAIRNLVIDEGLYEWAEVEPQERDALVAQFGPFPTSTGDALRDKELKDDRSLALCGTVAQAQAKIRDLMENLPEVQEKEPAGYGSTANGASTVLKEKCDGKKMPKEPSDREWRVHYACHATGISNQTDLAGYMTSEGIPITQGEVSRALKKTKAYLEAGGLPVPGDKLAKPKAIDPEILDMGERGDKLTPRQRNRPDLDSDSDES